MNLTDNLASLPQFNYVYNKINMLYSCIKYYIAKFVKM